MEYYIGLANLVSYGLLFLGYGFKFFCHLMQHLH